MFRHVRIVVENGYSFLRHCPPTRNNTAPTGRIFMTCDILGFFENVLRKFSFRYSDISNQQDAGKFVLLIPLSLLYMFRATDRWHNLSHRSAVDSRVGSLFQKAVCTVIVLLKMGETVARNM